MRTLKSVSARELNITLVSIITSVVISVLTLPNSVYGHAVPDSYTLEPNSILENSQLFPSQVAILFSEKPDSRVSYIHVTDSNGRRMDLDDFKITDPNGKQAAISIDKNLIRDGVYSISWLALSLDDGHVSKGTYVVGVGNINQLDISSARGADEAQLFSPILAIIKAPMIVGQVLVLGFIVSQLTISHGIVKRLGFRIIFESLLTRRFTTPVILSTFVMAIAATLFLLFQTALVTDNNSDYVTSLSVLLLQTHNGVIWVVRIICCAIILLAIYFYTRLVPKNLHNNEDNRLNVRTSIPLYIGLFAAVVFIFTSSFISHSSAVQLSELGISADFIHSIIVSIWIGGLMHISFVFLPKINNIHKALSSKSQHVKTILKSITLLILARFSLISTASIGIIAVTGLFLAWLHIHSTDELLFSDYGRTLVIKLCVVLPLILVGGYHHLRINSILNYVNPKNGNHDNGKFETKFNQSLCSLKSTMRIEVVIMMSVLCTASLLTVTSPPTTQYEQINSIDSDTSSSDLTNYFVRTLEVQGVPISFVITPFSVGFNNFTVNVLEQKENFVRPSNMFIEFKKRDLNLGPISGTLERENATAFSAFGGYLSQEGEWDLKITIKRENLYDLNYRLPLLVNSSSMHADHIKDSMPNQIEDTRASPDLTNIMVLISMAVLATIGFLTLKRFRRITSIQHNIDNNM